MSAVHFAGLGVGCSYRIGEQHRSKSTLLLACIDAVLCTELLALLSACMCLKVQSFRALEISETESVLAQEVL